LPTFHFALLMVRIRVKVSVNRVRVRVRLRHRLGLVLIGLELKWGRKTDSASHEYLSVLDRKLTPSVVWWYHPTLASVYHNTISLQVSSRRGCPLCRQRHLSNMFQVPIPNPNPITDPNRNPKINKKQNDTGMKLNIVISKSKFPRDGGGFIKGL